MQRKSAPLQKMVEVLETNLGGLKTRIFIPIFTIPDPPRLRRADTEDVGHISCASTASYTNASSEARVLEYFSRLLRKEKLLPTF